MEKEKAVFNWSGGKDSALALFHILKNNQYDITSLMTTVNAKHQRISMHGVRNTLLYNQGESIAIPIKEILLPEMPSMTEYDTTMKKVLTSLYSDGVKVSIFGDIFLEDLREYRENKLKEVGLAAVFPLWKKDTTELVHEFIDLGFKTVVVCVNADFLDSEFTGRVIDKDFLRDLPEHVDPCGENGEFHTFTFDGPIFNYPITYTLGDLVHRTYGRPNDKNDDCFSTDKHNQTAGFYFRDLIPVNNNFPGE